MSAPIPLAFLFVQPHLLLSPPHYFRDLQTSNERTKSPIRISHVFPNLGPFSHLSFDTPEKRWRERPATATIAKFSAAQAAYAAAQAAYAAATVENKEKEGKDQGRESISFCG